MSREFDADPSAAAARDDEDPLSAFADRFHVPDDQLYVDGNSLGPLSTDAERTLQRVVDEWREMGIEGWTDAETPWFRYAERLGDRLAPLVGAAGDEVVVANSTTVNVHTLIGTFYDAAGGDGKVVVNELDFPSDHYAIRAQLRQRDRDPDDHLVVVESGDGRTVDEDDVVAAMDRHDDVSILFMPSVLYRSGQLLDVERLTREAHDRDVLAGFDLAHSVGVVPHELSAHGVDFATWCSYKYLNAGPGAIAGLYVNEDHFRATPALAGWWGHEKETQFDMNHTFTPADSAGAWQTGTIPVLSAAPLEGSLDVIDEAGIDRIREKSVALTDYLVELVDDNLSDCGYAVGTPREPDRRGGHVALEHDEAQRISRALRDRGVVTDYRRPNVVRVCPSPLYTSFRDTFETVRHCWDVVAEGEYERYDAAGDDVT